MEDITCFLNYVITPDNILIAGISVFIVIGAFLTYKKVKSYSTRITMLYVIFGTIPFAIIFITLNTSCLCGEFCVNNILKLISIGVLGTIVFLGGVYHIFGSRIYLGAIGGKLMRYNDCPDIYESLKDVCARIGIKIPKLAYIDSAEPLAMSISGQTNIIALSVGAMESLEKDELKAVLAHEASHIKSHDPLIKFILNLLGISYIYGFMLTKNVEVEQEKRANETAEIMTSKNAIKTAAMKFKVKI